jgi:hypothetical protein
MTLRQFGVWLVLLTFAAVVFWRIAEMVAGILSQPTIVGALLLTATGMLSWSEGK